MEFLEGPVKTRLDGRCEKGGGHQRYHQTEHRQDQIGRKNGTPGQWEDAREAGERGWRARLVMQHAECQESDQEARSAVASPYFRIAH